MEVTYDWEITETNKEWHDSFFDKTVLDDHQAKGICPLYVEIFKYLEKEGLLNPNDTVFDPMCGLGTTMIIANLLGYDSIGNELEERYYNDMVGYKTFMESFGLLPNETLTVNVKGNITGFLKKTGRYKHSIGIINSDARTLTREELDKHNPHGRLVVITSPPYNRITEHDQGQTDALKKFDDYLNIKHIKPAGYENPKNIAMLMPSDYESEMRKVWNNMYKLGCDSITTVTRDCIYKGQRYPLASKTEWQITTEGYKLYSHIRAKIPYLSAFKRMNHKKNPHLPLIDWEDVLTFVRRLPRQL